MGSSMLYSVQMRKGRLECVLRKTKKVEKGRKGEKWRDTVVHSSIIPLQLVAAVKRNH